jgi:hypothetical protein
MKRIITGVLVAGSLALVPALRAQDSAAQQDPAAAQQSNSEQTTTQTDVNSDGSMTKTTRTTTVEGKVVRYEPGKTIVVMGSDNREMSYPLTSKVVVPSDVRVGRVVTLNTEPSDSGPAMVTRVTTRSVNSDGSIKTETQTTATNANGDQTTSKATTITGTVSAWEPGKSVTFVLPDKKTVVYTVDSTSVVPSDIAVGKTYTVQTTRMTSGGPLVVRKIVSTTTTKKSTTVN